MGAYFLKKQARSPILEGFGRNIYALLSFSGQQYFYLDRTGVDYIRVEYRNGDVEVFEYNFRWNWENYAQTSIRMSYGPGDVSYLDDVYLGGNRLSGYLDGRDNFVEYQGSR